MIFFEQIFALVTFILSVVHEKYLASSNRQTKRNKKKTTAEETTGPNIYTPNDKERVNVITSLINRLKTELNTIDAALGETSFLPFTQFKSIFYFQFSNFQSFSFFFHFVECWKTPGLPKTLTETLASLSLNPKVETLVNNTITRNHEITVHEMRTIIKDKLRCLNSLSKVNV